MSNYSRLSANSESELRRKEAELAVEQQKGAKNNRAARKKHLSAYQNTNSIYDSQLTSEQKNLQLDAGAVNEVAFEYEEHARKNPAKYINTDYIESKDKEYSTKEGSKTQMERLNSGNFGTQTYTDGDGNEYTYEVKVNLSHTEYVTDNRTGERVAVEVAHDTGKDPRIGRNASINRRNYRAMHTFNNRNTVSVGGKAYRAAKKDAVSNFKEIKKGNISVSFGGENQPSFDYTNTTHINELKALCRESEKMELDRYLSEIATMENELAALTNGTEAYELKEGALKNAIVNLQDYADNIVGRAKDIQNKDIKKSDIKKELGKLSNKEMEGLKKYSAEAKARYDRANKELTEYLEDPLNNSLSEARIAECITTVMNDYYAANMFEGDEINVENFQMAMQQIAGLDTKAQRNETSTLMEYTGLRRGQCKDIYKAAGIQVGNGMSWKKALVFAEAATALASAAAIVATLCKKYKETHTETNTQEKYNKTTVNEYERTNTNTITNDYETTKTTTVTERSHVRPGSDLDTVHADPVYIVDDVSQSTVTGDRTLVNSTSELTIGDRKFIGSISSEMKSVMTSTLTTTVTKKLIDTIPALSKVFLPLAVAGLVADATKNVVRGIRMEQDLGKGETVENLIRGAKLSKKDDEKKLQKLRLYVNATIERPVYEQDEYGKLIPTNKTEKYTIPEEDICKILKYAQSQNGENKLTSRELNNALVLLEQYIVRNSEPSIKPTPTPPPAVETKVELQTTTIKPESVITPLASGPWHYLTQANLYMVKDGDKMRPLTDAEKQKIYAKFNDATKARWDYIGEKITKEAYEKILEETFYIRNEAVKGREQGFFKPEVTIDGIHLVIQDDWKTRVANLNAQREAAYRQDCVTLGVAAANKKYFDPSQVAASALDANGFKTFIRRCFANPNLNVSSESEVKKSIELTIEDLKAKGKFKNDTEYQKAKASIPQLAQGIIVDLLTA